MKKLLIIPALLCAATCALAGCQMVNDARKAEPIEKIVAPQTEETPDETCPDCPEDSEAPEPETPENPNERPERPDKWIRDRLPRRKKGGDYKIPAPDKNIRRKG